MAEDRFRTLDEMRRAGSADKLSTLTRSPITFFDWLLARVLSGEPTELATPQLEAFEQSFVPAEHDFSNLRRHVCLAASALLVGRSPAKSAEEALRLAHLTWDGGWQKLDAAIEACGAAACAAKLGLSGAERELALWRDRAMSQASLDWVESYEEALYLLGDRELPDSADSLAAVAARVCAEGLLSHVTFSMAPLICALWRRAGDAAPLGSSLAGRAAATDSLVFATGDKPRIKIGKPSHAVARAGEGAALALTLKVTGKGPFSPAGYALAPFTFQLAELIDKVRNKVSRASADDLEALDRALEGAGQAVTFRVELARGVELSPGDEAGFRARVESAWEHARRSMRDLRAGARVEIVR